MRQLIVLLLCVFAVPLAAQKVRNEMVVSPEWLARHLDRVTIIEIGDRASYEAAHFPGARLIETTELLTYRNGTPNELPSIQALEAVFTRAGVGDRGRIILYSRDPLLAARAWFTLDYLGHGRRAAILDGGFTRWVDQGRPLTGAVPRVQTVPFHARVNVAAVTRFKAMKELVRFREVLGSTLVMIDARPPQQFCGDEAGGDVARAGHIPGAMNVPWNENLTTGVVARLLPERELRKLYTSAGVSARSTNVVYCRTGMQASLSYFVLRYLGYNATLYDGSYVEWSHDATATIADQEENRNAHETDPGRGLATNTCRDLKGGAA